jgi:ribonuclease Z
VHFAFLGTSGAVPSRERDTTSLVFVGAGESVLVDCGGSPLQELALAGVDPATLSRVIITHIHPDRAYALPSLVQGLLLLGRKDPLRIACRAEHVDPLRALVGVFRLLERPQMFPLAFDPVPARERVPVADAGGFRITASPNAHGSMPNMALRLILAHVDAEYHGELTPLAEAARARFAGPVEIARAFVPYPL